MGVEIAAGFEFAVASLLELAPGILAFAGRSKTIYSVVGTLISWDECTWDTGDQACDMLYTSFWSIFKVVCNFFGISNFWKSYWKMHCIWTERQESDPIIHQTKLEEDLEAAHKAVHYHTELKKIKTSQNKSVPQRNCTWSLGHGPTQAESWQLKRQYISQHCCKIGKHDSGNFEVQGKLGCNCMK